MGFGNKDLMTKLLPQLRDQAEEIGEVCALRTMICHAPTIKCANPSVAANFGICWLSMVTGDPTTVIFNPIIINDRTDLEATQRELKETLNQLDNLAKEELPSRITTRAQADEEEQLLMKRLDLVRAAKKGLE